MYKYFALILMSMMLFTLQVPSSYAQSGQSNPTGLPIPRMVSVKATGVNVRTGPGVRFPIKWVLEQKHLPVEVIAEYESWRKIRDWEGAEGWVFHAALSSRRSFMVMSNEAVMRREPSDTSPAVARLTRQLIGLIDECDTIWCSVNIRGYEGWLRRDYIWGLAEDEILQ